MKRSGVWLGVVVGAIVAVSGAATAQQRGRVGARPGVTRGTNRGGGPTVIREEVTIAVSEASSMLQRMGVFLVLPPAGSTAFGLSTLGQGTRVWAVLPSCRQPNPDDPRDPCPVARVTMTVLNGSGTIETSDAQTVGDTPDGRRVQSFVVPPSVSSVRIRLLRRDDALRYEANVEVAQLTQLDPAQGSAGGAQGFAIDLSAYPGR